MSVSEFDDSSAPPDSKDQRRRNLKVILSYDGTEFSGWQVQPDAVTVQGTLASAIGRITGEKVLPQGSGRTDAGVHALAQVMTFVTSSSVPTENFLKALNDILPASVRVLDVKLTGSMSNKAVTIQPTGMIIKGGIPATTTTQTSVGLFSLPFLVK